MKTLNVNGDSVEVEADDTTPLLWALRTVRNPRVLSTAAELPNAVLSRTSRRGGGEKLRIAAGCR